MKKDAKYYLSRTNDLPYFLIDKLTELKNQVDLSRYIYTSVRELTQRLELETDLDDFSKNTSSVYFELNTLLEKHDLKLVPCFIPSNIKFDDKILVTLKPNLNNDEDFSYVQELIKSKRVPTQKDAAYISRMSNKIANYNIMLRIFESLHVINKKVDYHLRIELDNIICNLNLPKEGFNYLKACYSFSCLNDNFKCNYENPDLCFKKLDEKNHTRFISLLAKLALCSSNSYNIDKKFPFYDKLLLEISHQKNLNEQKEKQSEFQAIKDKEYRDHLKSRVEEIAKLDAIDKQRRKQGIFVPIKDTAQVYENTSYNRISEDVFSSKLDSNSNYNNKKTATRVTTKKLTTFNKNTCFNRWDFGRAARLSVFSEFSSRKFCLCCDMYQHQEGNLSLKTIINDPSHIKNNKLLSNYFDSLNEHLKLSDKFIDLIKASTNEISIENKAQTDITLPLKKIILTKDESVHKFFPCLIPTVNRDELTRRKTELGLVANSVEKRLYTGLYFYYILILKEIFSPSDSSLIEEVLSELDEQFINTNDHGLLFIKTLYFILFKLPEVLDKKEETVDNILLSNEHYLFALYAYPQLIKLAIQTCLLQKDNIDSIKDDNLSVLFSLEQLLLEKENSSNKATQIIIPDVNCTFRLKVFIKLIRDNLYKYEKLVSFENCREDGTDSNLTIEFLIQNKGIHQNIKDTSATYICSHDSFNYILSPLLKCKLPKFILEKELNYNLENCIELTQKILKKNKSLVSSILYSEKSDLLIKLITNELDMKDQLEIIGKLNNLSFDNLNSVLQIVDPKGSRLVGGYIEKAILNLGLIAVPIEHALPINERCNLKFHKIIQTEIDSSDSNAITEEFYEKLACAQNAFVIYSYIVVENCAERNLIKIISPENELQEKVAVRFFSCLKLLIRGNPHYTKAYYARLARSLQTSETLNKTIDYLNTLIQEEMKVHPLASYFTNVINETLKPLLESNGSDTINLRVSVKKKFTVGDFDESKISSMQNESNYIQNVIESIRITEGSLKEDQESIIKQNNEIIESINSKSNIENDTISVDLPSDSARKLIDAISKIDSDVMDLNEFNGLCLSSKYMSKDVAIEEINDFCYEKYDEPLFDVDYEGNTVYITIDILNMIIS